MIRRFFSVLPLLTLTITLFSEAQAVSFVQYKDADGNLVTTNLPRSCVSDGLLICYEYYSVMHSGPIPVYRNPSPGTSGQKNDESSQSSPKETPENNLKAEDLIDSQTVKVIPGADIVCDAAGKQVLEKSKEFYPFLTEENCLEMSTGQLQTDSTN